jgi:hypothetical protein
MNIPEENTLNSLFSQAYSWIWNSRNNSDLTATVVDYFNFIKYFKTSTFAPAGSSSVSPYSYFCAPSSVKNLLDNWERTSFEDIIFNSWCPPSSYMFYKEQLNEHLSHNLFDYALSNGYIDDSEDFQDIDFDELQERVSILQYVRKHYASIYSPVTLREVINSILQSTYLDFFSSKNFDTDFVKFTHAL